MNYFASFLTFINVEQQGLIGSSRKVRKLLWNNMHLLENEPGDKKKLWFESSLERQKRLTRQVQKCLALYNNTETKRSSQSQKHFRRWRKA